MATAIVPIPIVSSGFRVPVRRTKQPLLWSDSAKKSGQKGHHYKSKVD